MNLFIHDNALESYFYKKQFKHFKLLLFYHHKKNIYFSLSMLNTSKLHTLFQTYKYIFCSSAIHSASRHGLFVGKKHSQNQFWHKVRI